MLEKLFACAVVSLCAPALVAAEPITSLHVLGDSLSDQGNGFLLTGGIFPPPPYVQRASNGPVAVERLAEALGVPLAPSAAGGTNHAVLGATTGPVQIPGTAVTTENFSATRYEQPALAGTSLQSQALAILQSGPIADPGGSLFVVWGGANDISVSPTAATVGGAVANVAGVIAGLHGAGARNFLVLNLPDLSRTPSGLSLTPEQQVGLQALTLGFNDGLASALEGVSRLPGIDVTLFDTFAFFDRLLADPMAFGFSNTVAPCITGNLQEGGVVCADPSTYVFWDSVHPTSAAHRALGDALAAAVVPEPVTLTLVTLGMGLAIATSRRRAA